MRNTGQHREDFLQGYIVPITSVREDMSGEPITPRGTEKNLEQAKVKDKTLHGEEIKTAEGNATQALIKKREGLASFKLTKDGQNSLVLVDENKKEHKDNRPLRKDESHQSLADAVGLPGAADTLKWLPKTTQAVSNDSQTGAEKVMPVNMSVQQSEQRQLKAADQIAYTPADKEKTQSDKVSQRSDNASEIDKGKPASSAPSEHPWEDERRKQLIAEYKADGQKNPEALADSTIKETKNSVDKTVTKMEVDRQKELVADYQKKGMTPEQATDAAKAEIQNSHDQLVSRINEQVQHFECIQRERLEDQFIKNPKIDRPILKAEQDVHAHEDRLVADIARMEISRRHELEQNRLTGKDTPEQIEKAKQDVDKEIKNTYSQMYDLMQKNCIWIPGMDAQQRQNLALEGLHQISDTTDIQQGHHEDCNATTVEATVNSRHPAEAARMLKEVALTGTYTVGGHSYAIPHENLTFHNEADRYAGSPRTFASQIMETTIVNLYYAKEGKKYYETDQLDTKTDTGGHLSTDPADTGERIADNHNKILLKGSVGQFAAPGNFMRIQNLITGEKGTVLSIVHRDSDSVSGVDKVTHEPNKDETVTHIDSVDDLKAQLLLAKANHKFPITVEVNIGLLENSGRAGSHVVTIRGYDDSDHENPKIYIDNQYSRNQDHLQGLDSEHTNSGQPFTPEKLYASMQFPGTSAGGEHPKDKPKPVHQTAKPHDH